MKLITVCGSPAVASANRTALQYASTYLATADPDITIVEAALENIPVFDPRKATDPPPAVMALSGLLLSADGVMIGAPEYAAGLSGGTKTALDWLVGLASLYHRPVVVLSAGTTGGEYAIDQLVRTLSWQGALVVDTLPIAAPRSKIDASGHIVDGELRASLERWGNQLVTAVSADADALLSRVTQVVSPFGIDAARFGDLT